jgi:hypothetical protein
VDTSDKLVLIALGDGSVRGIHLGTKKEVNELIVTFVILTLTY